VIDPGEMVKDVTGKLERIRSTSVNISLIELEQTIKAIDKIG
jgi:RNA-binding protein YlmH